MASETPEAVADSGAAADSQAPVPGPGSTETVVLGGGPCGLYAALTLAKAGREVTLIEKEEVPGGLARGHKRGENYYDLGVHMLDATLYLMGSFAVESVTGTTFQKFGRQGLGDGTWGMDERAKGKPYDVDDYAGAMVDVDQDEVFPNDFSEYERTWYLADPTCFRTRECLRIEAL